MLFGRSSSDNGVAARAAAGAVSHVTHYRPDIDGLRAVAVLAVVAFHAFPGRLRGGFVGVDVFFVISGFLISGIILKGLEQGNFSYRIFYARRIRRIFPALAVVLAATLLMGWWILLPDEYEQLGKHVVAGALFVSNLRLWTESGYFDTAADFKPLLHLWSLGIEEQFYIVWPIVLATLWRFRKAGAAVIAGLAAASFAANLAFVRIEPTGAYYLPFTRFWELLIGVLLAWYSMNAASDPVHRLTRAFPARAAALRNGLSAAGALLVCASMVVINRDTPFPGWAALAPTVGTALVIAAGPEAWLNRRVFAAKTMVLVGLISYPLYLWHWPLLAFLRTVGDRLTVTESIVARVLVVVCSVVLAYGTYRLLELPVRHSRPARAYVRPLVAAMVVVVALAGIVVAGSGLESRVPNAALAQTLSAGRILETGGNAPFCAALGIDGCTSRAASAEKVKALVVGDSHAQALFRGVAERDDTLYFGAGACYPAAGLMSINAREWHDRQTCGVYARMPELIGALPNLERLYIVARGAMYAQGSGFGVDAQRYAWQLRYPGHNGANTELIEAALRDTLRALSARRAEVYLLLPVPELGFHPSECVRVRPVDALLRVRVPCAVPRADVEQRQRSFREMAVRVADAFPRMRVVDPMKMLCDSTWCYGMKDGVMLYSDDDHLSVDGSRLIWSHIAPQSHANAASGR